MEIPGVTVADLVKIAAKQKLDLRSILGLPSEAPDQALHCAIKLSLSRSGFIERNDGIICELIIDLPVKEHRC